MQTGLLKSLLLQNYSTEYKTGFVGGWGVGGMATGVGTLPWAFPLVIFRSFTGEPKWEVNHLQIFPQIVIYGMEAGNTKAGNICQPGARK